MKKIWILNIAILLMAGVAVAGEDMMQNETNVKEKTSHSTTVQEGANQAQKEYESTTVEQQREATTSDDMDGDKTTQEKVEVEKKHSQTKTSEDIDPSSPGTAQEYSHKSETHHEHTTKEVEKN
jgi:cytoskeletal protein RodZ